MNSSATSAQASNPGLFELVRELGRQAAQYARDLKQLFLVEMQQNARFLVIAAMSLAIAAILLLFSFALLTVALMAAIAYGLGSWGWAALIVGVVYGFVALLLAGSAAQSLKSGRVRFQRTQEQVKRNKEWLKQKLAA